MSVAFVAVWFSASAVAAPYDGPWTLQWTFDSGSQGWTLVGDGARWVDPAADPDGPELIDHKPSGAGAANLFLPSGSRALLEVADLNLGNSLLGGHGFVLQADIFVPNLRPRDGINPPFPRGLPGTALDGAGISAVMADGRGLFVEGRLAGQPHGGPYQGQTRVRDNTGGVENVWAATSWEFYQPPPSGYGEDDHWWDKWVTLQLDYSLSEPGRYRVYIYIPWATELPQNGPTPGWLEITPGAIDCRAASAFRQLVLGGLQSDTQAQWDNVKLATHVPELTMALSLGFVSLALLYQRHRRGGLGLERFLAAGRGSLSRAA